MVSPLATPGSSERPAFLEGTRVLDVTNAMAGPYATTVLADLGAEVIKLEPVTGDGLRRRLVGPEQVPLPFEMVHRGKRSLAVDIKSDAGRELVARLAADADVFLENFRTGALTKQGLGYADLVDRCPDLVYCSISGFGQYGPLHEAKGVDLIAQAYGGLLSVTGSAEGDLAKAGFPIADIGTGMWAVIGVLAGLQRARAGHGGTYVDVSLADCIASWSLWEVADYVGSGDVPGPLGTAHRLAAPYEAFHCSDGRQLVIGGVDRSWLPLCDVLGIDLSGDPRYATEYQRFVHRPDLAEVLGARLVTRSRDVWIALLREAGVPCGPVNTIPEVLEDPHFEERGMFPSVPTHFGDARVVNTPIIADGAPRAQRPSPGPGEDTESILDALGLSGAEIADLARDGVIAVGSPIQTRVG